MQNSISVVQICITKNKSELFFDLIVSFFRISGRLREPAIHMGWNQRKAFQCK